MYIRKVTHKRNGESYFSYRLVEAVRTERGVRQRLVLNLGNSVDVPEEKWKLITDRIEEIITQQKPLFIDEQIDNIASRLAKEIIKKQSTPALNDVESQETEYDTVDLSTMEHQHVRSVGAEHVSYEAIRQLGIEQALHDLGYNKKECEAAIATIVARLVHPASERETHRWLQENSGLDDLMGANFRRLSLNKLYEISDRLIADKTKIENFLYEREKNLFKLKNTIALYDLTNTYFEGSGKYNDKARFGRSKEKRKDCPLVTLALVLDGDGFPKRSEILKGNVSEPSTLKDILDTLKNADTVDEKPLVIMDAGIATEENLQYLSANGYEYIVVSRKKCTGMPDEGELITIREEKDDIIRVKLIENKETNERELCCYSKGKELKEKSIKNLFSVRYEEELTKLSNGLSKKTNTTKKYDKVLEKIGRLKQKYRHVSALYEVTVEKNTDSNLCTIQWTRKQETKPAGVYCLRTNKGDIDAKTIWNIYIMLTDIESAFRSMKSELGMRPVFHQKTHRVDGHLFITLIGYHILHTIRQQLKQKNIALSWSSIRNQLSQQVRITTTLKRQDGSVVHIRKSSTPDTSAKNIYDALNLTRFPGKTEKTIV